tara:strand:+ start:911 stop:1690 length:780 start_codon:yes stop_codon:yes gene_type:complete
MLKNKLILPKVINKKQVKEFFYKNKMGFVVDEYNSKKKQSSFKPNLLDLYYLFKIIILNKRLTALEYGCGWSSLVLSLALKENEKKYKKKIKMLRKDNKFELYIFDNYKSFLNSTKRKMNKYLKNITNTQFIYSRCVMTEHLGNYCSIYEKKLNFNPDFIYLDGPSQFGIFNNKKFNFNTDVNDFMPMSADILKYEFFLIPGTIIVIDGRGANVNFLKKMFKRNWTYKYNNSIDQHYFLLNDDSFGIHNNRLISFWPNK